ncbi:MAG: hypothetical protein AAF408_10275 [Pseudomonadota bacterium]
MMFERAAGGSYMLGMRQLIFAIATLAIAQPLAAEDDGGKSLMEQGAELFFEGLRKEMSPALDNLQDLAEEFGPSMHSFFLEMGPAFADLVDQVQDWSAYHPPEILPNGDIILRKKQAPESPEPESATPDDQGVTDI